MVSSAHIIVWTKRSLLRGARQNTNLITQIVSEGVTHYTVCYTVENRKKLPKLHKNTQVSGLIFDIFWPKDGFLNRF